MENLTKPNTSIAFLNLLMLEFHTEISYYRTKILQSGLIINVKDSFLYSAQLFYNNMWTFSHFTYDIKNYWIKKHKINEERILEGERFRYIIFKEAFKKLAKKGRIRLIGEEIVIPIELRLKVLECIKSKLSEFPNIKVKIIDDCIINGMKHKHLPNLYLSTSCGFFLMFPIHGHSKFCHIIDEVYISTLVKTFNNIWNEDIVALLLQQSLRFLYLLTYV